MAKQRQLECRVVITNGGNLGCDKFALGMYDPLNERYSALGTHPVRDKDKVVRGLKEKIEREGHLVSFSEVSGQR